MEEPLQLIDGSGDFNMEGIEEFAKRTNLIHAGLNYQIVAIMGPQSSGKSTLLNNVFGTYFTMMDALSGRRQTTKGIWMAKSPKLEEFSTLILDLEGTDGRERGEDDTAFERQSALFALAISDIVMVNIWCHDIGREHGAGKPLMKTVFQVNLKLFTPSSGKRKTALVFVIRDKSKTPMERLVEVIEQDWDSIWDSITKPPQYEGTTFKDFFDVHYTSLPNYEEKEDDFKAEAYLLRKKFEPGEPNSYVSPGEKLPGDAVPLSSQKVWEVVRSQKDLDLPAHKIMVANTRCAEIRDDQFSGLRDDPSWETLQTESKAGLVDDFGKRAWDLMDSCFTGYDEEAMFFDAEVRMVKREELVEKVYGLVKPAFEEQVSHLVEKTSSTFDRNVQVGITVEKKEFTECTSECRSQALKEFGENFASIVVKDTGWLQPLYQPRLEAILDKHIDQLTNEKVEELLREVEKTFSALLVTPSMDLLDTVPSDLWNHLRSVMDTAIAGGRQLIKKGLQGYTLPTEKWEQLFESIRGSALKLQDTSAREVAHNALSRMKDRFGDSFSLDANKLPRTWTAKDNISEISQAARLAGSEVLAQLAILQSEGESPAAQEVEKAIRAMAKKDLQEGIGGSSKARSESLDGAFSVIGIVEWPNLPTNRVLISPQEVRSVWRRFMSDTKMQITQATMTQHANKLASSRAPPLWAIAAMLVLGGNEFLAVVSSPVLAICIIGFLLFVRTLYLEMDVDGEMQKGALPGMLSLSGKLMPAVKSVSRRTVSSVQELLSGGAEAQQPTVTQPSRDAFAHQEQQMDSFKTPLREASAGLRHRPIVQDGVELASFQSSETTQESKNEE